MPETSLRIRMNKIILTLSVLMAVFFRPAEAGAASFAVTSPWVGFIASFISGDTKNVRYLPTGIIPVM